MTSTSRLRTILAVALATCAVLAVSAAGGPGTADAANCSTPPGITGTDSDNFARYNLQLTGQNNCTVLVAGTKSLEWFSCGNPSDAGTCTSVGSGSTYTPGAGDVGRFIRLVESGNDLGLPPSDSNFAVTDRVKGRVPTADIATNPDPPSVKRNVPVAFDATGSSDPDGQALSYAWDLDGDNQYDDATGSSASTSFATSGTKTVRLRATDSDEDQDTTSVSVTVKRPPTAKFVFSPSSPLIGQDVTFTSTSSDADGDALAYAWDLDGDSAYDDGTTAVVHHIFTQAGTRAVGLQVSADGETGFTNRDVVVRPSSAPPPSGGGGTPPPKKKRKKKRLKLLRPFPKVAIGGVATARGARITLLGVRAPRRSKVMVKCRGRGCPKRTTRKRVGRKKTVLFRSFRRSFRAGASIRVYIWKKNRIGKLTSFRIRRMRPPARRDRCLHPTKLRAMRCPR